MGRGPNGMEKAHAKAGKGRFGGAKKLSRLAKGEGEGVEYVKGMKGGKGGLLAVRIGGKGKKWGGMKWGKSLTNSAHIPATHWPKGVGGTLIYKILTFIPSDEINAPLIFAGGPFFGHQAHSLDATTTMTNAKMSSGMATAAPSIMASANSQTSHHNILAQRIRNYLSVRPPQSPN